MTKRVCPTPGCPNLQPCTDHKRPTAARRGYGRRHQQLRARWQHRIDAGEPVQCWRPDCTTTIGPGDVWHLGHTDDRTVYGGPECTPCNLSHGGRAAHTG